jgi:release factor glutamine methyltransferase
VAAEEEAAELAAAAVGDADRLDDLVSRRCTGEPLAWIVGSIRFCGETVLVQSGVYVPRWQSESLALEAVARLPAHGVAVDLCTGSGALAVVLARRRPQARVLATETDEAALKCAQANGVDVYRSDLAADLPAGLSGLVDVVVAVVPYVPTPALALLPRDVVTFEPRAALDGGPDGTDQLARAVRQAVPLLRPGGSLLLEIGGDQADLLHPVLDACGFGESEIVCDEDGDVRALYARRR